MEEDLYQPQSTEKKVKKSKKSKFGSFVMFVLIVVLLGGMGWFIFKYRDAREEVARLSTLEGQQELQSEDSNQVIDSVKTHMELPEDENPTVATINDVDRLKENQAFFNKANNGDKLLVYVNNRLVVIFSPEKDIIVNVGTLALDDVTTEESAEQLASLDVEIRNGTGIDGLAQTVADKLRAAGSAYNIASISDAANKDYSETQVINLRKTKNLELVQSVGDHFNTQVANALPEGEARSKAEVVVIIGRNISESPAPEPTEQAPQ